MMTLSRWRVYHRGIGSTQDFAHGPGTHLVGGLARLQVHGRVLAHAHAGLSMRDDDHLIISSTACLLPAEPGATCARNAWVSYSV
jgi:hypothetical protein